VWAHPTMQAVMGPPWAFAWQIAELWSLSSATSIVSGTSIASALRSVPWCVKWGAGCRAGRCARRGTS